jgi:two-component system, cell cycle sensor histidine kinase and response regulator CckA
MTRKSAREDLEQKIRLLEEELTLCRQSEEALRESEKKYRLLFMNAPTFIYEADYQNQRFLSFNDLIPAITGYSREELMEMNPWSLFTAESLKIYQDRMKRMMDGQTIANAQEYSIRKKNGDILWINARVHYTLEDGLPVRVIVAAHDIIDRKRAEEALKESEAKYRGILENIRDSYYEVNLRGDYLFFNEAMVEETGYSREELMSMNYKQVICPDCHEYVKKFFSQVYQTGEPVALLGYDFIRKDGTKRNLETWVSLIRDEKGQPTGFKGMARDVTQRNRAENELRASEERLRQSEERYRVIIDNMEEAYYEVDLKGDYAFCNASALRNLGYSREDMAGMNFRQYVDENDYQKLYEAFHRVFLTGETIKGMEWTLRTKTREQLPIEGSISLTRDAAGAPVGFRGILRDITERKKAEQELLKSEEKYRFLAERAMIGIFWINDSFQFIYGNDQLCQIMGCSRKEVIGKSFRDILSKKSLDFVTDRYVRRQRGEEVPDRYEIEIVRPDGEIRLVEMMVSIALDKTGKVNSIGQAIDITERKQAEEAISRSEERYRAIFENTATANVILAEDKTILMVNNNFAGLSGYAKQEMEGKVQWTVFIHPDDLERILTYHRMRRKDARSVPSSYEFRFVNRQGEVRELFMNIAVIPGTQDSVASMVDLSERKKLETQLAHAQKMESVGRLAGGVAHDFNNMLSVIIGNTEMALHKTDLAGSIRKSLQNILYAGMRSADLTRQLLAFARRQTASPRVLNLNETIGGMINMLQRLIGENIELVWHPGHGLWLVKIDPSQVDQLLANLTVNARDAIASKGIISIATVNKVCDSAYSQERPEWIPGDYVLLEVSDNGCGMNKETLANIFEPFFTTKEEGQGTGLGLPTVYGIVRQNGGFINVYSEPGQGTTFRLYLPRCPEEIPEVPDAQHETSARGGAETILIVEDDESMLELSTEMLENLGYRVLPARVKDQALQLVREHGEKIGLLITDVVMPEINGKELSEKIRAIKPGLKCLYMSGYTADVIARQGILEEGTQFISKPFSFKDLAAKVREVLDS